MKNSSYPKDRATQKTLFECNTDFLQQTLNSGLFNAVALELGGTDTGNITGAKCVGNSEGDYNATCWVEYMSEDSRRIGSARICYSLNNSFIVPIQENCVTLREGETETVYTDGSFHFSLQSTIFSYQNSGVIPTYHKNIIHSGGYVYLDSDIKTISDCELRLKSFKNTACISESSCQCSYGDKEIAGKYKCRNGDTIPDMSSEYWNKLHNKVKDCFVCNYDYRKALQECKNAIRYTKPEIVEAASKLQQKNIYNLNYGVGEYMCGYMSYANRSAQSLFTLKIASGDRNTIRCGCVKKIHLLRLDQ